MILSLDTNLNSDLPVFSIVAYTFLDLIRDNLWEYLFLREEGGKLKKKHTNKRIIKINILNFFYILLKICESVCFTIMPDVFVRKITGS